MRRRIKKANIRFISLVPKGANQLRPVYKSEDGSVEFNTLTKFDGERGELTAVVYAPDLRDSQGDIADTEVVKQMAYDFISNGGSVDIKHNNTAVKKEQARVAETFLVQKSDDRFQGWKDYSGNPVNLTGAWATVIKIDDPDLREKYRSGEWSGVSMGGTAEVVQEKTDFDNFVEQLSKALNLPPNPEPETDSMDETKILKSITDGFEALGEKLVKALTPPDTTEAAKKAALEKAALEKAAAEKKANEDTPKYVGQLDDDRALTKFGRRLELHQLKKAIDWADPKSILSYREQVALLKEEWETEDDEAGIDVDAEKEEEEARNKKRARKGRSVTAPKAASAGDTAAQIADGVALANEINKAAGFEVAEEK